MYENLINFERELTEQNGNELNIPNISDEEINKKYKQGEIRIVTEQARYPLNQINEMLRSGDYELKPQFQRRLRWKRDKQSRLIESFIMNVPIAPIFLYENEYSHYEVMDGLQRLTAIKEFYDNEYKLEGLEAWPELNGRLYRDLPEQIKKGIDRRYLSSIILLNESAKSEEEAEFMKQLVFSRINSGGAKLEDQETRNALHNSEFNRQNMQLARNRIFCEIFDIPTPTEEEDIYTGNISDELRECEIYRKMKDVELVLRFFALRKIDLWSNSTFSKFLDKYSNLAKNVPDDILLEYKDLFESTILLAYEIYGENTFSVWKQNKITNVFAWSKKPAVFIYDCMMVSLSKVLSLRDVLIENKDRIIEETKAMMQNEENMVNGRNTSRSSIENRIDLLDSIFSKYND